MTFRIDYFRATEEAQLCYDFLRWQTGDSVMSVELDRPMPERNGSPGVVITLYGAIFAVGFFGLMKKWESEGLTRI